jgi:site-specific DNA-cytosine methylase
VSGGDDVQERPLNVLSLCSGYGGLELGLRIAGVPARTILYVEREAYAAAVLDARMREGALDEAPVVQVVGLSMADRSGGKDTWEPYDTGEIADLVREDPRCQEDERWMKP